MRRLVAMLSALALAAGCATMGPRPGAYEPFESAGVASYIASRFDGLRTSSGAIYDERRLTAAHRTLAFGTRVRVENVENGRSVVVTVTDRGPFHRGRIIDVSRRAAIELGFLAQGTTRVRLEVVTEASAADAP